MAFRGTFELTLDAKNRLTVPAKLRAALADGVVLAKGVERNVGIWRPGDYETQIQATLERAEPDVARGARTAAATSPPAPSTPSWTRPGA